MSEFHKFKTRLMRDNVEYKEVLNMGNGEYAAIHRFMFTFGIIRGLIGDQGNYEDRWCYDTYAAAEKGLFAWRDSRWYGEPQGWHRHPTTGRRRPHGDPTKEYINP